MQLSLIPSIEQIIDSSYCNAAIDPAKYMDSCGIYHLVI